MNKEKKLEVRDLRISFKTQNGKVQAVRDISFDLYKGETLAIVGESGSGKSVTSRAIMGILAGNAIKEGGKILYDGMDLMKVSEEEFHRVRGDKIAMVFQDPLSSLNPIMKVGKQLTEAMLLKNKAAKKESKAELVRIRKTLSEAMTAAGVNDAASELDKFRKICDRHAVLETEYVAAVDAAEEALAISGNLGLMVQKKKIDHVYTTEMQDFLRAASETKNRFVVHEKAADLDKNLEVLKTNKLTPASDEASFGKVSASIARIEEILKEAISFDQPDTFALGYYLSFDKDQIPSESVGDINKMTRDKLNTEFLDAFMEKVSKAVRYSIDQTDGYRKEAIALLKEKTPIFEQDEPVKADVEAAFTALKPKVAACINPLEVVKDSLTHTFPTSMQYAIDLYYNGGARNEKEERRYAKYKGKHDALVAKGKTPDWEVIPKSLIDLDAAKEEMAETVTELTAHFEQWLKNNETVDVHEYALRVVDNIRDLVEEESYTLTKRVAKERAIQIMEDVGIDEPRKRFNQYPFEFSGGMRQRIVIAIALTANPDVLICDEPTTALDVTIQAQILELINKLQKERNLSVIFITHDLGVVANMADRIAVMYAGKIVETGTAHEVFYEPAHPYTWALLSSVPDLDTKEKLMSIPGTPPNMIYPPKGDAFAERNIYALKIDFEKQPPMFKITDTHYAATWLLHPNAPKKELPKVVAERINRMKSKQGGAAV